MTPGAAPLGPPWERPFAGRLDRLVVESDLLRGNPLGDPARRPLWVYVAPGVEPGGTRVPSVYVMQGYTGQLDMWTTRRPLEPTALERFDAAFAAGACAPALVVFVDTWTRYGGGQSVNSTATGPYADYLCDEVVPLVDARYPTLAAAAHRGIMGKSSGGYAAMALPMLRPGVFGALASHAGDALFEACYLPDFPAVARTLRDQFAGSYDEFFRQLEAAPHVKWARFGQALELYACATAYSPDPNEPRRPLLPFDANGRLVPDVWERWLEKDPVRMVATHQDTLRGLRHILIEAGGADEYFLDLGAQAMAAELARHGVEHTLRLLDETHAALDHRYPVALAELVAALS